MRRRKRRRRLKVVPTLLTIMIIALIVAGSIYETRYLTGKAPGSKSNIKIPEIVEQPKIYRTNLVMVGDALIHSSVYNDAAQLAGWNGYDFKPQISLIKEEVKMDKKEESDTVPAAESERIAADITEARNRGAEAVIVLMNWGKVGKTPDKAQKALAQSIADAGADLIIGAGSRVPQAAEYLTVQQPDGNEKEILCIWSLGTVLSGDRSNIRRISGYLLHVRIHMTRDGKAAVEQPEYTPLYTWRYRQDGQYYYRCLAANRTPPDGMDNEQIKNMDKAAEAVRSALAGSPLSER